MVNVIQDPPDEPLRSDPTTFAVKREAWLTWEKDHLFPGLNAAIAGFNPLLSNYEKIVGAANFKGLWSALSGPLTVPASVAHVGKIYVLLQDAANVALEVPGVSSKWAQITSEAPEQFSGAANLSGQTVASFGDFSAYRDVEFIHRGLGHSLTSGDFRHLMIQLSTNGTTWGTAVNVTTTTNRMGGGVARYAGFTRIRHLNEGATEIFTFLAPSGSGTPSASDASNHATRLYTTAPVKYARFVIEATGSPTFTNGVIIPTGIGAPVV